jgi:uncharacterized protein YjbI with pentapeptide repeats
VSGLLRDCLLALVWLLHPKRSRKDCTVRGKTYRGTVFRKSQFSTVRFEKVTFERCRFDLVTVEDCVFIDCVFKDVSILSGVWTDTRFQGGHFSNVHMRQSPESDDAVTWERLQFESLAIEQWFPVDRSGHWRQCTFRKVQFIDDDFHAITMYDPRFVLCSFRGVRFPNSPTGHFEGCHFANNLAMVPGVGGVFKHVKFHEPAGVRVLGPVEDGEFLPSQRLVSLEQATRVVIQAPQFGVVVRGAEDVRVEGASGNDVGFFGDGKRVVVENVVGKWFILHSGTYEDCVFRNIEVDGLDLTSAHFVRCEFQNVLVKRTLLMSGEVATFLDCKFDRFRRLPQVAADSYSNQPPHADFLFPFEITPGVNKPQS